MSELDTLRLLCWPSAAISMLAALYTGIPVLRAQGPRPFHLVLFLAAAGTAIGSVFILLIMYDVSVWFSRPGIWFLITKPAFVGAALLWLGWEARRRNAPK